MSMIESSESVNTGSAEEFLAEIENEKIRRELVTLTQLDAYDWHNIFPKTTGMGAAGDVKRRVRMLQSVEPRLEYLLYPGERIEFITKGTLNSFLEQFLLGIWSVFINRTLFLFTNYRVILVSSDGEGRAKAMMWQIPYDRMKKFGAGRLSSSLRFKLVGSGTLNFSGVPSRDRKSLREYVRSRVAQVQDPSFAFPSHAPCDSLCTTCGTPVQHKHYNCSECSEEFIKPRTPALLSLLLPGLGDAYLGNHFIGVLEAIGFLFVLGFAFLAGAVAATTSGGIIAGVLTALIVILIANTFDAIITLKIASKGKLPKRLAWKGK